MIADLGAIDLGPMPTDRHMCTVDEQLVRAPAARVHALAADVERWPALLSHYRFVRFRSRNNARGGVVEMSANRPFGILDWPTWWLSEMVVTDDTVRFRHIGGITTGMDVEWTFERETEHETRVRIVHVWNGPPVPVIGPVAAISVIGPVFVHGIASRTLAGLARVAEDTKENG
jgi:ribosome-associated toxin RatA of RatAB toxin-antitoxin module